MIDPDIWYEVAFWTLAGILVIAAIFTIETKEVMHSIYGLATTFICVAGIFVLLNAEFLAIIQILVYVGAVSVLLAFAIMLTRRRIIEKEDEEEEKDRRKEMEEDDILITKYYDDGGEE